MTTEVTNVTGVHMGVGTDEFASAVADFVDEFENNDAGTVEVTYERNGLEVTCTGSVGRVQDDRPDGVSSIDMWINASNGRQAYLHVNPHNGSYMFSDPYPEQGERKVTGFKYW